MTETNAETQLHSLMWLQRTAQTRDGVSDGATRRDRLRRAATMLAHASDANAAAVFTEPERTSPTAKTPGRLVRNRL
jgi:hypothetical protein